MRRSSSCSSEKAKFMGPLGCPVGRSAGHRSSAPGVPLPPEMCTHVYACRVEQIGVRELRANLAAAIRQAGAGERVVITIDGRPVAQLGPLEPSGAPSLEELAASGLLEPPRRTRHD